VCCRAGVLAITLGSPSPRPNPQKLLVLARDLLVVPATWQPPDTGIEAFAERARRELRNAGEAVANRTVQAAPAAAWTRAALTAQKAQVARMARDGLSNPEVAARLFISARTVQYHLARCSPSWASAPAASSAASSRRPGAWRATLARSACYAVRWCEQGEGAGLLDGLGAAARAELLVQVPLMGLDGVHR